MDGAGPADDMVTASMGILLALSSDASGNLAESRNSSIILPE
jgi:hypothetical protein